MKSLRIALSVLVCVIALSAVGLAQNVGPGPGVYPATGGSGGVATVTGTSPIVSSGGAHPAISLSGVTAEQGNGTKVQLSTGSTTTNDCVKFDANGNTIDNGSGCGGQPIYTQTITESTGAATMTVHSSSVANIDVDYLALNAAATITTPAAASMADGEQIYLDASTSGGAFTTGFTAGAGTSLATIVLGDGTPFATPAACGAVPATGHSWTRWQYRTSNTTLTLLGCGVNPPPSTLGVALGGSGGNTFTAHGQLLGEGTSAFAAMAACAAGSFPFGQGSSADPICSTLILPNSATTGDILTATSSNNVGSLADVATGSVLASGGTSTAPAYTATPNVTSVSTGTNPSVTAGTGGVFAATEGSASTGKSSTDELYANSTDHFWHQINNNGTDTKIVANSSGVAQSLFVSELGAVSSTAGATLLVACDKMLAAGSLSALSCTSDIQGTCTTAPTFGTRDVTTTTNGSGTVACGNTAGFVTQATPGLTYASGDEVCLTRTVDGATCLTSNFVAVAH